MAIGDFTGDGRLDAAVALEDSRSGQAGRISFLEGEGNGTFVEVFIAPFPLSAGTLQFVDVDLDAAIDLVATASSPGAVSVLRGRGALGFAPARHYVAGLGTDSAVVLGRDGSREIVAANAEAGDLSILRAGAAGELAAPAFSPPVNHYAPFEQRVVAAADLDGDGRVDIVVLSGQRIELLRGAGRRAFTLSLLVEHQGRGFRDLAVEDLDEDGRPEIVTCNAGANSISVHISDAPPGYGELLLLPAVLEPDPRDGTIPYPQRVVAEDLNGDGALDLVAGYYHASSVSMYSNQRPTIHFRRGDAEAGGVLDISDAVSVLDYLFLGERETPGCLDAVDANDDGRLDVSDAVSVLGYLFLGSPAALPEPLDRCGFDRVRDDLTCLSYVPCSEAP